MTSAQSRWFRDPSIRALWRASWNEPHMQIALQVLQELAGRDETVVIPGVDLVQLAAINGARREGFQRAIESIRILGTERTGNNLEKKIAEAEWPGWAHVDLSEPPDAPATPASSQDT